MRRYLPLLVLAQQLLKVALLERGNKTYAMRRHIFDTFWQLGGVYVKFLQLLVVSVDFMRGWAGPTEYDVFEKVTTEPLDIYAVLQKDLPQYTQQFSAIADKPFAAGSFAQVYHATLTDGTPVIIKVLRPALIKHLKADLRVLAAIVWLAQLLRPSAVVNLRQAFSEFKHITIAETDYQRETANALWFYRYFQHAPKVVVPFTYQHLCSASVITQQYIGGVSLAEVLTRHKHGDDPSLIVAQQTGSNLWQQLETVGAELLKSTLVADFVLGDPHPGNIKLLPDNKVGLIDFGIAAPAPRNRLAFYDLMREYKKVYEEAFDPHGFAVASLHFFDKDLVSALRIVGRELDPTRPINFVGLLGNSATDTLDDAMADLTGQHYLQAKKMLPLFNNVINANNRFGISVDVSSGAMLKSAQTFLSTVNSISTMPQQRLAVVKGALTQAVVYAEVQNVLDQADAQQNTLTTPQAFELVSAWLTQVANNDPFLYRKIAASITA